MTLSTACSKAFIYLCPSICCLMSANVAFQPRHDYGASIDIDLTVCTLACSKRYKFEPDKPEERRRLVLTIAPLHWAAEWVRPVPPNFKMVGPILAEPGKPLPQDLEVLMPTTNTRPLHFPDAYIAFTDICSLLSAATCKYLRYAWHALQSSTIGVCLQAILN